MTTTTSTARAPRTRLTPEQRRAQLLDLGVRLLATRSIEELSIDLLAEEAGVSRGLMYHYFGSKQAFHEAVVRHAADDLIAQTAPQPGVDAMTRLLASMEAYVDYVVANREGYQSLVRAAAGGNETMRRIYDDARWTLTDRIFTEDPDGELIADTPAARLVVRGWAALAEEVVLSWCESPDGVTRDELLAVVAGSLPALVDALPAPTRA